MRILVIAGIGAIALTMPLTIAICVVLAIVATSYWQTIRAYPNGASSYLVASDNLGVDRGPRRGRRPPDRLHAHGRRLGVGGGRGDHVGHPGAVPGAGPDRGRDRRSS